MISRQLPQRVSSGLTPGLTGLSCSLTDLGVVVVGGGGAEQSCEDFLRGDGVSLSRTYCWDLLEIRSIGRWTLKQHLDRRESG